MKRPITEGDKWRLDVILKRKAVSLVFFIIHPQGPQGGKNESH